METSKKNSLVGLPGAIIIAAAIIGIAIIWTRKPVAQPIPTAPAGSNAAAAMAPVTAADHILGNPDAPIKLVEYSDPSCPYCKMFDPTMQQIITQYGPTGQVAWIYRQFPLDQPDQDGNILHPHAGTQAEAFECAAALGGNTGFWAYEKEWFATFPQDGADESADLDNQQIAATAKTVGLDAADFSDCVSSARFKDKIQAEYVDGLNAGVSGTPSTVLITPSGTKIPLQGVQSYDTLNNTIEALLSADIGTTTAAQQ